MRVLVTGATGFVGGHLIEAALQQGDQVLAVSLGGSWHAGISVQVQQRVELLAWDIRHSIGVEQRQRIKAFAPEALVHLAGLAIPVDCGDAEPTDLALQTNVGGTEHALDLAESLEGLKVFLLASSCHVYQTDSRLRQVVDESWPIEPSNGYGRTKQLAEQLLWERARRSDFRPLIARGFQQTGLRQPKRLILPEWIAKARAAEHPLRVRCLGTELDLIDVRDAVQMILRLMHHPTASGVYNIASGHPTQGALLIQAIEICVGKKIEVRSEIEGERFNPIANIERLRETIGAWDLIPVEQTVAEMWREE